MSKDSRFTAIVLDETDGKVKASIRALLDDALPEGDVTVAVSYSTLNYKDGMILNGLGGMVRSYPHVPGIDFAGRLSAWKRLSTEIDKDKLDRMTNVIPLAGVIEEGGKFSWAKSGGVLSSTLGAKDGG